MICLYVSLLFLFLKAMRLPSFLSVIPGVDCAASGEAVVYISSSHSFACSHSVTAIWEKLVALKRRQIGLWPAGGRQR